MSNGLRKLWRRVVREWKDNETPHLAQVLRLDASPRSHTVLLVCAHRKYGKCRGMQAVVLRAYLAFLIERHEGVVPPTLPLREAEERATEAHLAAGFDLQRNVTHGHTAQPQLADLLPRRGGGAAAGAQRRCRAATCAASRRRELDPAHQARASSYCFAVSVRDLHEMHVGACADFDSARVLLQVGAAADGAYLRTTSTGICCFWRWQAPTRFSPSLALSPRQGAGRDLGVVESREFCIHGAECRRSDL